MKALANAFAVAETCFRATQKKPAYWGYAGFPVNTIGGGADFFLLWRSKNEKKLGWGSSKKGVNFLAT
ncbi:hypothetical protein Lpp126_18762 [Lacticaseibacillus paracasei subsp. paracasei Lpp126]|uniref:Uncharacterized protein n=1 Tax=Lacticaseibacillus paracasei subsp. paracasei Lpp126 TaxID=1256206 RepID=S2QPR0_LACPA|nr:hypothetical protein Lpp126_18762 [Lacticaseibacillus paracasei subsp. paracasei Lpp126]